MTDRLAEIKARYVEYTPESDRTWLIAEIERLKAANTNPVPTDTELVNATIERAAVIADGMAEEVSDGYSGRGMTCVRIAAAIRAEVKHE